MKAIPEGSPDSLESVFGGMRTLSGVIASLAQLEQSRKQALLLKSLASLLLPALVIARKTGAAEMGFHPAASLSTINESLGQRTTNGNMAQNGMQGFLNLLCDSHGIYQSSSPGGYKAGSSEDADSDHAINRRIVEHALALHDGSQHMRIETLRLCVNICEALPDIGGVLRFSTETLRAGGAGIAPGPEAADVGPNMLVEDQIRFSNNIARTVSLIQHLDLKVSEGEYWDDFLVRSVTYFEDGRPQSLKIHYPKNQTNSLPAAKNPFIHDALASQSSPKVADSILIADETATFRVTLQNLYEIELVIECIRLESKGLPVEPESTSTRIGPCRTQTILVSVTPRAAGNLVISGCVIKVQGCRERRFPIFNQPWTLECDKRDGSQASDERKGANPGGTLPTGPQISQPTFQVSQAQPAVVLSALSAPHSAIMLLDGEKGRIEFALRNDSSTTPVDVLVLTFDDSATAQSKDAVNNRDLTALELYELEHSAVERPALKWITEGDRQVQIASNGQTQCLVDVYGKPGLSMAEIRVDYGYRGTSQSEAPGHFYTRELTIPLTITVNASLELVRNDILPIDYHHPTRMPRSEGRTSSTDPDDVVCLSGSGADALAKSPACLLVLEFRNSWPNPLTLTTAIRGESSATGMASHRESIAPGHIARVPLMVPKMYIPSHERRRPIPSLSAGPKRQYVVSSSSSGSPAAELAAREVFWYRQRLLERLHATWEDDDGGRSGSINVRSLRLSPRMLDLLKLNDLEITTEIVPAEGEDTSISSIGPSCYRASLNMFFRFVVSLRNRSGSAVPAVVRFDPRPSHQPAGFEGVELSRGFVWNGTLQQSGGVIEPGASTQVHFDFCIITEGSWRIGARVEEMTAVEEEHGENNGDDDWAVQAIGPRARKVWTSAGCQVVTRAR